MRMAAHGILSRYAATAQKDGLDPNRPSIKWLEEYLFVQTQTSMCFARHTAAVIGAHLKKSGCEALLEDESIIALLAPTSGASQDPLNYAAFPDDIPRNFDATVRTYACHAYTPDVQAAYGRYASAWEVYARRNGHDAARPNPRQLAAYLAILASTRRHGTIVSISNALSHYFRSLRVSDVTKHPAIKNILSSIARNNRPTTYRALFTDALLAAVKSAPDTIFGRRNRVICLLAYLGPLSAREIAGLDRSSVTCRPEGIDLVVNGRHVFIGGLADSNLDLRVWMAKWLKVHSQPDLPLFCRLNSPNGRMTERLTAHYISAIVSVCISRGGAPKNMALSALRKGFVMRTAPVYGIILVAQRLGYKNVLSVGRHSPYAFHVSAQVRKRASFRRRLI